MKKFGAAMLLAVVITGAGVAAPASAVSAAGSEKATAKTNVVSIFGMWPTRE